MFTSIRLISSIGLIAESLFSTSAITSSHRETLAITKSPKADSTDFYIVNLG